MANPADLIAEAWHYVWALPLGILVAALWLTLLVELPRYFLGLQATAAALLLWDRRRPGPLPRSPNRVSLLLVGHNEEGSIEKCVRSLREQTFNDFEIVCVDDGSTDKTAAIMAALQRDGLVQSVGRLQLRGGKAAGLNFAARLAKGDIFVVVDCDCSFDANAIEELIRPIVEDTKVAAVSGNILVRNWRASFTASLQAIEYLVSISLGKSYSNIVDQVCCVSGAFGAFRREAWERIHGMDAGGGEDLDFTIRLRLAGYKVVFAREAVCYTDVPETLYALMRQRNRWERDSFWIRFRKFKSIMNPFHSRFSWRDAVHQWDFLIFSLIPAVTFPFYMAWIITAYPNLWLIMLIAISIALFVLDIAIFVCALLVTGKPVYWRLVAFLPIYGVFQSYVMRMNRLYAYVTEWIYSLSLKDNYVPEKVRCWYVGH